LYHTGSPDKTRPESQTETDVYESQSESEPEALYLYDTEGICRWVNSAGLRLLNLDASDIVGRHISGHFPGIILNQSLAWRSAVEKGEAYKLVSRVNRDDRVQEIQLSLHPSPSSGGSVGSLVCSANDLSGFDNPNEGRTVQLAEQALIGQIASTLSSSLQIEDVYERFASEVKTLVGFDRMTAIVVDEVKQTFDKLYVAGQDSEILSGWKDWPLEGTGVQWVVQNRKVSIEPDLASPEAVRFKDNGRMLRAGFRSGIRVPLPVDNKVIGIISLWGVEPNAYGTREQEILERLASQMAPAMENARIYQETQRALETLRTTHEKLVRIERLRAMGELASGVAHDFNNSLAAILGRAQLLINQTTDETFLQSLRLIEQAAKDSAQMVRRILEFARVDPEVEYTAVDLSGLAHDVVELTRHKWSDEAQSKGQSIRVTVHQGDVPPARGNYAELREALTNIVINACESITGNGVIEIRTESLNKKVCLSVSDTGAGMKPEVLRRIFDPFFTTKSSTSTGMGLSVAFGIVSRHGGNIDVESHENVGTTMRVSLPAATSELVVRETAGTFSISPTRVADILVIEDEPTILDTMEKILTMAGHRVTLVQDGEQGISLFRSGKFDIVFTDLGMPGLSGWEVAEAIKRGAGMSPSSWSPAGAWR
jgi:signal transduction histidine kinase